MGKDHGFDGVHCDTEDVSGACPIPPVDRHSISGHCQIAGDLAAQIDTGLSWVLVSKFDDDTEARQVNGHWVAFLLGMSALS